jgi:hypothetical protein
VCCISLSLCALISLLVLKFISMHVGT